MPRALWHIMRGPRRRDLARMDAFDLQLALAMQFAAWMAVGFVVLVPPGLVFLALALWRATRG